MVKHSRNQPSQQKKYRYNHDYRHDGKMVADKPEHIAHHIAKHRADRHRKYKGRYDGAHRIKYAVSGVFFSFPCVLWCRDRENPKQGERGASLPGEKRMLSLAGNVGLLPGRKGRRKWKMAKKNQNIFLCISSMLIE